MQCACAPLFLTQATSECFLKSVSKELSIIKFPNLKLWCLMTKDRCCENIISASDSGWGNMLPLRSCSTCSIWGQQQQCGSENWKSEEVISDRLLQKWFKDTAMHWQTFLPCLLINSISLAACHPGNPRVVTSCCRRKRKTSSWGPCGYHITFDCKKKVEKFLGSPWSPVFTMRHNWFFSAPTAALYHHQANYFFKSWSKIGWREEKMD